jgi:hypothetical protein
MKFKLGVRQAIASSAVFGAVVLTLVSFDEGVRERFYELIATGNVGTWSDRAGFLGDAMLTAAKHQSLENAPLVVFATIGAMLFLFMVRT